METLLMEHFLLIYTWILHRTNYYKLIQIQVKKMILVLIQPFHGGI